MPALAGFQIDIKFCNMDCVFKRATEKFIIFDQKRRKGESGCFPPSRIGRFHKICIHFTFDYGSYHPRKNVIHEAEILTPHPTEFEAVVIYFLSSQLTLFREFPYWSISGGSH